MKRYLTGLSMILWLGAVGLFALPLDLGVKGGLVFSNFRFSGQLAETWKNLVSLRIGAFASFRIFKNIYLQPEFLYSRNGARFMGTYDGAGAEVREHLSYLEFPLLAKMRFSLRDDFSLSVLAGGFGSLKIGAKSVVEYGGESSEEDIKDEIKPLDFGVVFGAELGWKRWVFDIRCALGLADLKEQDTSGNRVYNRALAFMLGYRF